MKITEDFTFFWGNQDPFSNWHRPAEFTYKGIKFAQSEQFMMFCKAMYFKDTDIAEAIMANPNPKRNKELGRRVKGFNVREWEEVAYHFVYVACREKFLQNRHLLMALLETGDTEIVEASPVDPIWGIGLHQDDEEAQDKTKWKGKNLLGEILTVLRNEIRMVGVDGMDRSINIWWD